MNRQIRGRSFVATLLVLTAVGTMLAQNGPPQNDSGGAVFAMTNATAGNEIVVYRREAGGTIRG